MHYVLLGPGTDATFSSEDVDFMLIQRPGVWEFLDSGDSLASVCRAIEYDPTYFKGRVLVARTANSEKRWGVYRRLA